MDKKFILKLALLFAVLFVVTVSVSMAHQAPALDPRQTDEQNPNGHLDQEYSIVKAHDQPDTDRQIGNPVSIVGVKPVGQESITLANQGDGIANLAGFTIITDSGDIFQLPSVGLPSGGEVEVALLSSDGRDEDILSDDTGSASLYDSDGKEISKISYHLASANRGQEDHAEHQAHVWEPGVIKRVSAQDQVQVQEAGGQAKGSDRTR